MNRRSGAVVTLLLAPGLALAAEDGALSPEAPPPPGLVRIAASERYQKGRIHRFAFGGGYRELWEAAIELPLLDLDVVGGGLTPTRRFGGLQTAVLGFRGRDGRSYTFRGTDKNPSAVLDPELLGTIVQSVIQDQMAAQHPGGPLVASVVSEAAGIPTIHERMLVMPDDPQLGEFRSEFAGMVGNFYEYPTAASASHPGFHGATEIIGQQELYERLRRGRDDEVDVEAFLRARLFDLLIGDFDRHRKQWRWARLPGGRRWQPIPEDRDMSFARYEGVGPRLGSLYLPILQRYGPDYPRIKGLTFHGWEQDRWLLPRLSWPDWEPIARDLRDRITDEVIERALRALPPEYAALDADRLRHGLRGRRDRLLEGARSFYRHLAGQVDVQASDEAEEVRVEREADGRVRIEIRRRDGVDGAPPVFRRTFEPDVTRDVRLYVRDGDDVVTAIGEPGPIRVRVIAGEGRKLIDDSRGGGVRVYDAHGSAEVRPGPGTRVDRRPYEPPAEKKSFVDVDDIPPRDWGSDTIPMPNFGFEDDVGAFLGLSAIHTRYGFRRHPWSSRHRVFGGWATKANRPRVGYRGTFRAENSPLLAELDLSYSGIDILRFYGLGNQTRNDRSLAFFRVRNERLRVAPSLSWTLVDDRVLVTGGPWLEHSRTVPGERLIDLLAPYGAGNFGSVGAFARVEFDTRRSLPDHANLALPVHRNRAAGHPTRGLLFQLATEVSPPVWDVERTRGSIEGSLAGFLSAGERGRATLGLRVGGRRTFGRTPYFAAAFVGGGEFFRGSAAVRGYRAQRFAGDASVFANADLRIFLARLKLAVPSDVGILGFADVGRVFLDGESSRKWHPSWGGGVWLAPLARTNTISFSVADSPEDTLFYLRVGFHY